MFRVVETNDFNQLPHITLAFRPGNDAAVKSFLAGRLSEVRASHTSLERDLSRAQVWRLPLSNCPLALIKLMSCQASPAAEYPVFAILKRVPSQPGANSVLS